MVWVSTEQMEHYFKNAKYQSNVKLAGPWGRPRFVVVQTVLLLQQNGHGARMSQVELLELLPLDAEGLPALERAAWTNGNKDEQTVLFCFFIQTEYCLQGMWFYRSAVDFFLVWQVSYTHSLSLEICVSGSHNMHASFVQHSRCSYHDDLKFLKCL